MREGPSAVGSIREPGAEAGVSASAVRFYVAEEYHQDYIAKNPNGYCPDHSTGVTFAPKTTAQLAKADEDARFDNSALMSGQHIVVIDAEFCPYCEKFKETVANDYRGDVPMHFRMATQLNGLSIESPTWATPTLLFMEDGKEVYGIQGYVEPKTFYKALGAFKLGESEAFDVAFNKSTDSRFCKQYGCHCAIWPLILRCTGLRLRR